MQSMQLDKQIQIFRKKLTRVLNKVKEKMASEQANVLAVLYLISLLVSDQGGLTTILKVPCLIALRFHH